MKNHFNYIFFSVLFIFYPLSVHSEISFKNISETSGVQQYHQPTAASSWGDLNNDGWPDLWVSNHHGLPPSLLLNQKNGTFKNITDEVLPANLTADFHGAAWADFDNDGDQDIAVVTGGGAGRGSSSKYLFVNENGKLVNKAAELGVEFPQGRGRTPLWFDANKDGKLDLVMMNRPRENASSVLFVQSSNSFVNKTQEFGFFQGPPGLTDKVLLGLGQLIKFQYPSVADELNVSNEFAQLADLNNDNHIDLLAFMQPSRFYAVNSRGFDDLVSEIKLPAMSSIQDAATGDFDGDGQVDMFLTKARTWSWSVSQTSDRSIKGKMGDKESAMHSIVFRTVGEVTFQIHQPWIDPSDPEIENYPKLQIGSRQSELSNNSFTLSPNDPVFNDKAPVTKIDNKSLSIMFNALTEEWTLSNFGQSLGFIISSSKRIDSLTTQGFKSQSSEMSNALLLRRGNSFVSKKSELTDFMTSCSSATSGDFDNDMDLDLYLVCTGPTENYANILYENDGSANFRKITKAGGAEGSRLGRGNQVAMADFDQDGYLDLFVTNGDGQPPFASDGPYELFENAGSGNNWLEIDLSGVNSNRDGIGAKIVLEVNNKTQLRFKDGGMHSFSQNHARIHFGLGEHDKADNITVYWPSGAVQRLQNVTANQILLIHEQP